jgi:DNA-binding transcriptional MocR family regulator
MNTIWQPDLAQFDGPKYRRLVEALRNAVQDGALNVGEKVPPVRDLAWRLNITPGTVARAYTILSEEGVLEAGVGRGTFVAPPRPLDDPIEIDAAPHGKDHSVGPVSLYSPVLPNVGQAQLIRKLMADIAQDPPSGLMHYPSREGFRPAREAVVSWLEGTPLGPLDQDDLVLTHGGQNGVSLVLQAVSSAMRSTVYVEELSYQGFRRVAELLRLKVVPIPMDEHGLSPEALHYAANLHGAGILCTSPEVHNPTLQFTPEDRRREIVDVARKSDLLILEDDCYRLGAARAPTYRMLAPERGWYVSSISKTLTPALRIGFAVAPHQRVAPLRAAAEHGFFGLATPLADLAEKLLTHPQIDQVVTAVSNRIGAYVEAAVNQLGGYELIWRRDAPFLWLRLPLGWRAGALCLAAERRGVRIRPGEEYTSRDAKAPHAVRLAVNAGVGLERFENATAKIRDLLDNPPERISV